MSWLIREAVAGDAPAIAAIHNEGVADRVATFRSEPRPVSDVEAQVASGRPLLVAERDGEVAGWAGIGPYDDANEWYAGVGEATVYVGRAARGRGVGGELLARPGIVSGHAGHHKLIAKVFDTNAPSLRLFARAGYTVVGTHRRHGQLDGEWRDVVVLEKSLGRPE